MKSGKYYVLVMVFILVSILTLNGCGKSEKVNVLNVQKKMLDYVKSDDYKKLMYMDITDEMLQDTNKLNTAMIKISMEAEKQVKAKGTEILKASGFDTEKEYNVAYEKVKADPEIAKIEKELGETVDKVVKEATESNISKIKEKSSKLMGQ